jgi:Mn-dependent DtxR family transcriptional regulator
MEKDSTLTLTDMGKERAEKIFERHSVLKRMLLSLGVNEKTAEEDACRMEHVISDESLSKIKESLK